MKKAILIIVLLIWFASAALIHGTVYGAGLEKVGKAIIELEGFNSTQVQVAQNGSYSFEAQEGKYEIRAKIASSADYEFNQTIIVGGAGVVFDLVLLGIDSEPFLQETEFLDELDTQAINETQLEEVEEKNETPGYYYAVAAVVLAVAAGAIYFTRLRKKNGKNDGIRVVEKPAEEATARSGEKRVELHREEKDVLEFVEKNGGSATQKELRRALPYSESKISMVLTNLEGLGKLRKTKSGRGNVIRLN
ncbi:hypothetical protein HY993_04590 [Candidatus Micrarchaeota archaeon]|nr:hypothetical protein [Candidatus Micrarchaeota archaeon]